MTLFKHFTLFMMVFTLFIACQDEADEELKNNNTTDIIKEEIETPITQESNTVTQENSRFIRWKNYHQINDAAETYKAMTLPWTLRHEAIDLKNPFYGPYFQFFIYSPDSSYAIDLDSYSLNLEYTKKGMLCSYGGEVDHKVSLIDLKNNTATTVLFAGTLDIFEDAYWEDNSTFRILGQSTREEFHPTIWEFTVDGKRRLKFGYLQTTRSKSYDYNSEIRLKAVNFLSSNQ